MLKARYIIPAVLLAVVLLVAEIAVIRSATEFEPEGNAVFAAERIEKGTLITEDMLEMRSVRVNLLHRLSARSMETVTGKQALADIEKDEMILKTRTGEYTRQGELTVNNPDSRLFTVEFEGDQANGWQLKSGCHVDIIFIPDARHTLKQPEDEQAVRLEDIRVAALIDKSGNVLGDFEKGKAVPKYISFELEKGQDEFLAYAKFNGRLEVSLIPGK